MWGCGVSDEIFMCIIIDFVKFVMDELLLCFFVFGGDYFIFFLVVWVVFEFFGGFVDIFYIDVYFDIYYVFEGKYYLYVFFFVCIMEGGYVRCLI